MKRRHFVGVSMARRVEAVRPRSEREIATDEFEVITRRQAMRALERVQPDDPPRRMTPAGRVIVAGLVAAVAAFALFYALAERIGGHL